MKKVVALVLIGWVLLIGAMYDDSADVCKDIDLNAIRQHAPIPNATIVSKKPVFGMCEVIMDINSEIVPIYASKDYIIAGEIFSKKRQITQASIDTLKGKTFQDKIGGMKDGVAFEYMPEGPIRHTVYMFSSPMCPHCNNAMKSLKDVLDRNHAALKVLFQVQGEARNQAIEAVCKKVDLDTYNSKSWLSKNTVDRRLCPDGIKIVDASTAIARQIGINGVPQFYLENGVSVVGNNMPELDRVLKN